MIQTSSWVIAGMAAGINFREAKAGTHFGEMSPFLPHYVKKPSSKNVYKFGYTFDQKVIYDRLYGQLGLNQLQVISSKSPSAEV